MPRREAISHHRIERQLKWREAVQEFFVAGLEEREVRFIISDHDICRRLLAGLRALQLDVILIRDQISRDEDAALRQHRTQSAFLKGRPFLPGPQVVIGLPGDIHPDQRKLLWLHDGRGARFFFACRNHPERQEKNADKSEIETTCSHQVLFGSAGVRLAGCSSRFCSETTL